MGELYITGDSSMNGVYYLDELLQQIEVPFNNNEYIPSWTEYTFKVYTKSGFNLVSVVLDGVDVQIVDNKATFKLSLDDFTTNQLTIVSESNQPPKDVAGFNYLYSVTSAILKLIAGERFITGADTTTDLGLYIINVLQLPFTLNTDVLGTENSIVLGNNVATTKAVEILDDEIIVDLGSIVVPHKFNNSYDYINTVTRLHLPFTNTIDLDINYVIGYEINVKYIIDLYYGDVTINVSSSKIDNIIHSETTKIGRDIPFIRKYSGEAVNSITTKNGVNNGLLKPFIEVTRNIPYEQNNIFKNEVITHETLNNVTGFITVNNIILNSSATQNEKTTITNLLRSGVYIK